MSEPSIHIYWTDYSRTECWVIDCPTCERPRRMSAQFQEWYGWTVYCAGCGDSWQDGEMMDRPFARGWRRQSIEHARKTLASIGVPA